MKNYIILVLLSQLLLTACSTTKKVQVYHTYARIIKLDTANRDGKSSMMQITWLGGDGVEYVSFSPMPCAYYKGMLLPLLLRR